MSTLTLDQFLEQCRSAEAALAQPCAPAAKEQALSRLESLLQDLAGAKFSDQDRARAIEALLTLRVKGSTASRIDLVRGNMARALDRANRRGEGDPATRLDVTF